MKKTVAFLDVLGFRDLVQQTPSEELGPWFAKALTNALQHLNQVPLPGQEHPRLLPQWVPSQPLCSSYAFSDSIMLFSRDDTATGALAVLLMTLRTMQSLLSLRFATRAAVTFGDMFVDLESSVFLGTALTSAYTLEQNQDWAGGVVDDSVAEILPSVFGGGEDQFLQVLFPLYEVPLKTGHVRSHRTINWRWNLVVQEGTRSLFRQTSDWQARRKITNALEYAQWVRRSQLAYPSEPEAVPLEVRAFFVGSGPPPPTFDHGDEL